MSNKITMNVNAKPFIPSSVTSTSMNITMNDKLSPHQTGKEGFVLLDYEETPEMKVIHDEELLHENEIPLTEEELRELESVDEYNELLAELDVMESQEEMHRLLNDKIHNLRMSKKSNVTDKNFSKTSNVLSQGGKNKVKIPAKPIMRLQQPH